MTTTAQDRARWSYLRDLMTTQLSQFEKGVMSITANGADISKGAIVRLKRNIHDIEGQIARSAEVDRRQTISLSRAIMKRRKWR